jgi:hypothetical protein
VEIIYHSILINATNLAYYCHALFSTHKPELTASHTHIPPAAAVHTHPCSHRQDYHEDWAVVVKQEQVGTARIHHRDEQKP